MSRIRWGAALRRACRRSRGASYLAGRQTCLLSAPEIDRPSTSHLSGVRHESSQSSAPAPSGRAVAGRLDELGHDVTIGTRDPQATLARTEGDAMVNLLYAEWAAPAHRHRAGFLRHAAAAPRSWSLGHQWRGLAAGARACGAAPEQPGGQGAHRHRQPARLLCQGMQPPTLLGKDTDSLGEQIQRAFPGGPCRQDAEHPQPPP